MARKAIEIDKDRVVQLYEKYGTMNDVAIRMSCTAIKVKGILVEKGIEIKQHDRSEWNKSPAVLRHY